MAFFAALRVINTVSFIAIVSTTEEGFRAFCILCGDSVAAGMNFAEGVSVHKLVDALCTANAEWSRARGFARTNYHPTLTAMVLFDIPAREWDAMDDNTRRVLDYIGGTVEGRRGSTNSLLAHFTERAARTIKGAVVNKFDEGSVRRKAEAQCRKDTESERVRMETCVTARGKKRARYVPSVDERVELALIDHCNAVRAASDARKLLQEIPDVYSVLRARIGKVVVMRS